MRFPSGKLKFTKVFHQGSGYRIYNPDELSKYTIQALVSHQGQGGEEGHYVAYCKD